MTSTPTDRPHDTDPADDRGSADALDVEVAAEAAMAPRTAPARARRPRPAPTPTPRGPAPDGPIVLVRPVRQSQPGTMPAGLVLMVVALALVVAMFLNAPATLRKSRGKVDNAAWRTSVAEGVNTVSDFFFLDEPRNAVDEALGKNQTTDADIDVVVAEAEGEEPVEEVDDLTPVVRTPTVDAPITLYVGGDSMADGLATTLSRIAGGTRLFAVTDDGRVSTGLSRPDFFNWPQHLARDIDARDGLHPDVAVLLFGANDLQNIPLEGGGYVVGTQEWLDEYRRRVGGTMDLMRSGDGDRMTYWLGMPPMGPGSSIDNTTVEQVNHIVWSEAQTRPWIRYVDTWSYFAGPDGAYADELVYADGQARNTRAGDEIHMEQVGYERMAWAVMDAIEAEIDLSANPPEEAPAQQPPADLAVRTEVPAPPVTPGP